jgi:ribosome biogenesis GTPase
MTRHDRGRHTTTAVQLYPLSQGGYVADTPGIKELHLCGVSQLNLVEYFAEMAPLIGECRFRDCAHLNEPGCAIHAALEQERISRNRYQSYVRIMEGLAKE